MQIGTIMRHSVLALGMSTVLITSPSFAREFVSIGGGGTGGTFNTMASGIGSLLTDKMDDARVSVEGSAGSVENIRRIGSGDLQMGIAFGGDAYLAYNGLEAFENTGAVKNLRYVAFLYSAVSQIVTTEDSKITSLTDLSGKRLSIGSAGSGTAKTMERILEHLGLADEVRQSNVGGSGSSDQLKNGQLDAYHGQWGVPAGAIVDTSSALNAKLISTYEELKAAGFLDTYPFYSQAIIPAGAYMGIDEEVLTIRDAGVLVVGDDVKNEIVYEAVKNLYSEEGLQHMLAVSNATREMSVENGLVGASIPLHPGAAKFWEEMGIELPK